jgi:hypothetical protein
MLQSFLFKIKDHRRAQGRRYLLGHILLFSILAILSLFSTVIREVLPAAFRRRSPNQVVALQACTLPIE